MHKIIHNKAIGRGPAPNAFPGGNKFKLAIRRIMWRMLPPERLPKGGGKKYNGMDRLASTMLKEIIRPDGNVLAVGPSLDYRIDPSALFVCHRLYKKDGNATLIDFRAPSRGVKNGNDIDYGDLACYSKSMDESIVLFKEPFLSLTDVFKLGFKDNSFDVILDHSTSFWLCMRKRGEHGINAVRMAIKEYQRVLKKGGKVIMMVKKTDDYPGNAVLLEFWSFLKEAGFRIAYEKVEDKYEFPVRYDIRRRITANDSFTKISLSEEAFPLFLRPSLYKSSNVLVATKP
jgi:SAM-dependent methyltransferase